MDWSLLLNMVATIAQVAVAALAIWAVIVALRQGKKEAERAFVAY